MSVSESIGDSYIVDQLLALRKVVKLHATLKGRGLADQPYFPDDLDGLVDFEVAEKLFERGDYLFLQRLYCEGWIRFVVEDVGESVSGSVQDFVSQVPLDIPQVGI